MVSKKQRIKTVSSENKDSKHNFLRLLPKQKKILFRILTVFLIVVGVVAISGGALYAIYKKPLSIALTSVKQAKQDLEKTQQLLVEQNFVESKKSLESTKTELHSAQTQIEKLSWTKRIPYIGTQYQAIEDVFQGSSHLLAGMGYLIDAAQNIFEPLQKNKATTFANMSEKERKEILSGLKNSSDTVALVQIEFKQAINYFSAIPTKGVLPQIRSSIEPIQKNIPTLEQVATQFLPLSTILPTFLGYPDQQNYLLLFQNNTELRPTGGFIGTYGIIKVANASITSFTSDNVYNLDGEADKRGLSITPPSPLTTYNGVFKWFLRDSNWSPDFPTSAQKALEMYSLEGGTNKNLNGVIAIDPTFISSLLTITGSITVNGTTFTSENFVSKLQQHVTQGFQEQRIDPADRKDIIGDLGKLLLDKLFALPKNRWSEIFVTLEKNLGEKHLLFWMKDTSVETFFAQQNWDGHVTQNQQINDLLVVDANLASLKTDPAVQRTSDYTLTENPDHTVTITLRRTYNNTGKLTWKTTRYRTYTRIYVPQGSTFISSSGQMVDCKKPKEGTIDKSEDLGHSVFAFFVCTEPGESKTVTLTYQLPARFTIEKTKELLFHFEKQPGTVGDSLIVHANLLTAVQRVDAPLDKLTKKSNTDLLIQDTLTRDSTYSFLF